MPFKVTVGGQVLTTEDLTLDEIEVVEQDAGDSWLFIVQAPAKSARHAKAVLTAVLRHGGMDAAEASALAGGLTLAACYLLPIIQSFAALAAAFAGPAR